MNADPISLEFPSTELQPHGDQGNVWRVDVQDEKKATFLKLAAVRSKSVLQTCPEGREEGDLVVVQRFVLEFKVRTVIHAAHASCLYIQASPDNACWL